MVRTWSRTAGLAVALFFIARPADAQVVQSVQFGMGGFFPRGIDARISQDVLRRNIIGEPMIGDPTVTDALTIQISDFRSFRVSGEWNISFDPHVEVGAEIGFHRRSVPSVYRDVVDENFNDIPQTIRLRVTPLTGFVRFLPFGSATTLQPYIGAGVTALNFRYSEIGEFVDPVTLDIFDNFNDPYEATGTAIGGLVLYGLRVPLGGDIYAISFEGRYQWGSGNTGGAANGFVADKIDLGGGQFNVGFLVRF